MAKSVGLATGQKRFNRDVVVITGGLGLVGLDSAQILAEQGASVCLVDIVAKEDIGHFPIDLAPYEYVKCDVSDSEEVREAVETIENTIGPIRGLFNNAATKTSKIDDFFANLEEYSVSTWNEIMNTNLLGMFLMGREVGTRMANRREGAIVQTASIYGSTMGPDQRIYEGSMYLNRSISSPVSYTVSKAGVHGLTNHFATYWGHTGVRVNTISPGGIHSGQNDEFVAKYSARVPLGRMADVREVSHAASFLLSKEASYITGTNLMVDGGLSAW